MIRWLAKRLGIHMHEWKEVDAPPDWIKRECTVEGCDAYEIWSPSMLADCDNIW